VLLSEKHCQDPSPARQQQAAQLEPGAFAARSRLVVRELWSRLPAHRAGGECPICGAEFRRKPSD